MGDRRSEILASGEERIERPKFKIMRIVITGDHIHQKTEVRLQRLVEKSIADLATDAPSGPTVICETSALDSALDIPVPGACVPVNPAPKRVNQFSSRALIVDCCVISQT